MLTMCRKWAQQQQVTNLLYTNQLRYYRYRKPPGPDHDAGMQRLSRSLKLTDEELEGLTDGTVESLSEPDMETMDMQTSRFMGDIEKNKKFARWKIIEQKYFKDLYKIKPGEVYTRNKDPYYKKKHSFTHDFRHSHHRRRETDYKEIYNSNKYSYSSPEFDPSNYSDSTERPLSQSFVGFNPVLFEDHKAGQQSSAHISTFYPDPNERSHNNSQTIYNDKTSKPDNQMSQYTEGYEPSPRREGSQLYSSDNEYQSKLHSVNAEHQYQPKSSSLHQVSSPAVGTQYQSHLQQIHTKYEFDSSLVKDSANKNYSQSRRLRGFSAKYEIDSLRRRGFPDESEDNNEASPYCEYDGPNLLTWAMKEQLRHLNTTDPEAWPPLELSTAFPMSAKNIKKVLRSHRVAEDDAAVARHDRRVVANWQCLTRGKVASVDLISKVVQARAKARGLGEASEALVPVGATKEMLALLDSFIYEDDSAGRANTDNQKGSNVVQEPVCGYFVHIIKKYEQSVKSLRRGTIPADTSAAKSRPVPLMLPQLPEYEGSSIQVVTSGNRPAAATAAAAATQRPEGHQRIARRGREPDITYEEFMRIKMQSK